MIRDLKYMRAYKDILTGMSFTDFLKVVKAFGDSIFFNMKSLPDKSTTHMTKDDYLNRLSACSNCKVRNGSICDPTRTRAHISELDDSGQPKMVNGCGCNLPAKQKSPTHACPAGEWKVFLQ